MNFFNPIRIRSILVTLAVMAGAELLTRFFHLSPTVAPLFVALVYAAYTAGIRAALVSAVVISGYAIYLYPTDLTRLVVVIVSLFSVSAMVGTLKMQARIADTLNGNVQGLVQALALIRILKSNWKDLSVRAVDANLNLIENEIGNISTRAQGWRDLRRKIQEVEEMATKTHPKQETPEVQERDLS